MPLQNRVNPEGEICFSSARGTFMGNRGSCLHNAAKQLVYCPKPCAGWITCLLEFKGRKRELMSPGLYTELFFLDEATALAAGHRPCAECRRPRYSEFRAAWGEANRLGVAIKAGDMDAQLRLERSPESRPHVKDLSNLPDGVMVKQVSSNTDYLIHADWAYQWAFEGYSAPSPLGSLNGPFLILTPASTIGVLRHGYRPDIHFSAR